MRYYVEINGESSLDIQGLMIQSLPSISKPLIRSKQETIDGRDGDIITKLGYGAYDKTLKIGLWGNYDINEVIAFFNQEGTITFSNEPDKYYRFTILNREDYVSQLDKFRTATIMIHCQPFKYKLNEEAEEIENEYTTNEGTSLTFNNSLVAPLQTQLKGNTSQTGTPTPSSPIPVNVVSGDNTITISNSDNTETTTYNIDLPVENLFDKDNANILDATISSSTKKIENSSQYKCLYIPCLPNTTYTIQKVQSGYLTCGFTATIPSNDVDVDEYTNFGAITTLCTITSLSTSRYLVMRYYRTTDTLTESEIRATIQIEYGSKANTYTPYGTTPIELNKIGTYQDYIYKQDNKWYLHKETGKVVFNGSENWDYNNSGITGGKMLSTLINDMSSGNYLDGICNYFINNKSGKDFNTIRFGTNNKYIYIYIYETDYPNKESFTTWLGTHNTSIYYILATPTNTEITYTPLIEQLDAILEAQSKKGTTNINQINNDLPFIINASVLTGTDSITITNEGNTTSKPILNITGSGVVGVYLENIQMFNITLGTNETIIIDTENMEAYYGSQLKNRQVTGDYSNFALQSGTNNLKFTGLITNVEITNYNRWI